MPLLLDDGPFRVDTVLWLQLCMVHSQSVVVLFVLAFVNRVSLWSPGCLGTHCNPPASASRVLWFHSAHPFLLLVSQMLQKVLHCLGSWPLLCGYRASCFPRFVHAEMSRWLPFSQAGILCPGILGCICKDLLRDGWLRGAHHY